MEELQPAEMVWGLINTHTLARCMHVIAEFGVADALDNRASSAAELASATGLNADALGRMLRLVAAHGVFASKPEGYVHTPASRLLRSDHPQSLRSFARMIGMPVIWRGFTDLAHPARTGKPATDMAGLVAYFSEHPAEASLFNQAMVGKSASVVPAVVEAGIATTAFRALAESPKSAPACDHIRHGYRCRNVARHMIYFRVTAYGIAIGPSDLGAIRQLCGPGSIPARDVRSRVGPRGCLSPGRSDGEARAGGVVHLSTDRHCRDAERTGCASGG